MKKIFTKALAAIAICVASIMSMTSCGGGQELTEAIPADIQWAVKLNVAQMLDNAGGKIDSDGKISLPSIGQNSIAMQVMAQPVLDILEQIDIADMVVIGTENGKTAAIALVRDQSKAIEAIEKLISQKFEKENGYQALNLGGAIIAFKDYKLYVADKMTVIDNIIESANNRSLDKLPAISKWLTDDNAFAMVVSPDLLENEIDLPSNFSNYWICAQMTLAGQTYSGELTMMDIDGKRYEFGNAFGEVDTDFLRYIPDGTQVVAALGRIESPEIKATLNKLASELPDDTRQYITALDGTIAGALNVSSDFNPMELNRPEYALSNMSFLAMIHYPQATVNSLVSALNAQLKPGAEPSTTGVENVNIDGINLWYGNIDGYFTLTNYTPAGTSENEFTPLVEGTRGVIAGIQYPQSNPYGLSWGSKGRIWLTSDAIKMEVTLTNTNLKFMEAMIEMMQNPKFQAQMRQAINEVEQNYGYYDYLDNTDDTFGGWDDDEEFFFDSDSIATEEYL